MRTSWNRMRERSRAALLAATLCTSLAPPVEAAPGAPAKAATPAQKTEAKRLAAEGRKAMKEERWADAVKALRRSNDLDPKPDTKLDLARTLVQTGKLVDASILLHAIVDADPRPPGSRRAVDGAKRLLGEIEPRIPWLQIDVKGPDPSQTATAVDGKDVDASAEVPLDPGEHVISAEADGYESAEKRVTLSEGAHERVRLVLKKVGGDRRQAEAPQPSSGGSAVPAVLSFTVAAVGVGVGAVFGVMAFGEKSKADDAKDEFRRSDCDPGNPTKKCAILKSDFETALDASKGNGTVSTIAFVTGGVGLAAGVVFLMTRKSGSSSPAAEPGDKASARPFIGPGQVGVVGRF